MGEGAGGLSREEIAELQEAVDSYQKAMEAQVLVDEERARDAGRKFRMGMLLGAVIGAAACVAVWHFTR